MQKAKEKKDSFSAHVTPLIESEFFPAVIDLLDHAEKSISICVFAARYYTNEVKSPINYFFHALRRAAHRGVGIRLLLNANFGAGNDIANNMFIVQRFKSTNFETALGGKSTRIHSKLILIDDNITVLGSHNYSARASKTNFETSVIINSFEINLEFKTAFNRLWKNRTLVQGTK